MRFLGLLERDLLPDVLIRFGIRRLLATAAANAQHYEVPTEFFKLVLGRRLTYSAAFWPDWATSLDRAEEAMLEMTLADINDLRLDRRFDRVGSTAFRARLLPSPFCLPVRRRGAERLDGAFSSSPAPSSSAIGAGRSGGSAITSSAAR